MRIDRWVAFAALVFCGLGNAYAADMSDSCQISADEQKSLGCVCTAELRSPTALLDQIKGEVLKSDSKGFNLVSKPTPLSVGDGVLVLDQGNALLIMGENCRRQLGPNASLEIRRTQQGCACAALLEDHPEAAAASGHPVLPIVAAGVIAGAVAALIHPSSP